MKPSTPDDARQTKHSLWSRLRTTPLGDLVRGRLTARLDVRTAIEAANLPEPLAEIVVRKASRKWRWTTGRLDFAQTLANRMRSELDAGHTAEELAASLSDAKQFAEFVSQGRPRKPFWSRLVHTPLSDALRGRLTASLDVRGAIAAAGLSEPLPDLIRRVARRSRLWRAEKVDVARELCDHFQDGIAAGHTPEQLVASFGEVRQAARLIRRAKLRSRPLVWRAWRRFWQAIGVTTAILVASYLFLWARLSLARPTLAHNYALEITAPARAVPENDRAWPFYREALLQLTPAPRVGDHTVDLYSVRPGDEDWALTLAWLSDNRDALKLARDGAARRQLGFLYGDAADKAWYEHEKIRPENMNLQANRELVGLLLPHLQRLRGLEQLLIADARRAVGVGDRQAFLSDVRAILAMGEQIGDDLPFLVVELISFSLLNTALSLIDETLAGKPDLFSDSDLKHLAHTVAGYAGGGRLRVQFDGEKLFLRDIYQRIYTDDGNGDGHLTHDSRQLLRDLDFNWWNSVGADDAVVFRLLGEPALSALMLSRRPMTELTEQMLDRLEGEISRPLWQWQQSGVEAQIRHWRGSRLETMRYLPIVMILPSIHGAAFVGEKATQQRDATLVALALELYRRRHGTWPALLGELTPDLLPDVPPDRYTGEPIVYRLIDGRPLLYSVGPDRIDDGGKSLSDPDQDVRFYPLPTADQGSPNTIPQGDWVLWPQKPKPEAKETAESQPK